MNMTGVQCGRDWQESLLRWSGVRLWPGRGLSHDSDDHVLELTYLSNDVLSSPRAIYLNLIVAGIGSE